jgi:hypothetical protein
MTTFSNANTYMKLNTCKIRSTKNWSINYRHNIETFKAKTKDQQNKNVSCVWIEELWSVPISSIKGCVGNIFYRIIGLIKFYRIYKFVEFVDKNVITYLMI